MAVEVKGKQTLLDIAIQKTGTIEALFATATLNDKSPTADLVAGEIVQHPDIIKKDIADYYRRYNLLPASATTTVSEVAQGGIDFWASEFDFTIS